MHNAGIQLVYSDTSQEIQYHAQLSSDLDHDIDWRNSRIYPYVLCIFFAECDDFAGCSLDTMISRLVPKVSSISFCRPSASRQDTTSVDTE